MIEASVLIELAESGLTAAQIGEELGYSYPTILKYADQFGIKKIRENGKTRQFSAGLIDGRASYRKFKKSNCESCGIGGRLEVHHKEAAKYNSKWQIQGGNHSQENLMTVCNSCHQKIHYREMGRKPLISDGVRFYAR